MIGAIRRWRDRMNPGASLGRVLFWVCVRYVTSLLLLLVYRLRVFGWENIPQRGPVLLLCNHQSYLDLLVLGTGVPHRCFHPMARKTLFRNPLFANWIRNLNAIELDQSKGDIKAIRMAIERLSAGHMMLLFPEGSRTEDGRMRTFQEGVMLLIRRARPTIVPAALEGVYDAWPIWSDRPRFPARMELRFGPPIPAEKLLELPPKEALARLARQIDQMRLELRARIRLQTRGRYPRPGPADQPSPL